MIYGYIKEFLANKLQVQVDSDGIGPYLPLSKNKEKYDSAKNWFDYWKKTNPKMKYEKCIEREKICFPELFE